MVSDRGMPMSCAACLIASTAWPSDTPGAVSKPSVAAGYWATRVTCSGAICSSIRAMADSGVAPVLLALMARLPRVCTLFNWPCCASRITRYWLVSVKMVETMRWPKAL
ncbi:hypothetical protein D3C72_1417140 [compost metagenome]